MTNEHESYLGKQILCGGRMQWRVVVAALGLAAAIVINILLGVKFGKDAARWSLVLPLAAGGWFAWEQVLNLRRLDEMQARLFYESLSLAALAVLLMAMLWPSLERAGIGGGFQPLYVTLGFPLFFMLAYLAVSRKYL
jgi:hypothetical protein